MEEQLKQAFERIGNLELRIAALEEHPKSEKEFVEMRESDIEDLALAIANKAKDCNESEHIQKKVLDVRNPEAKVLMCFYVSYKYFGNAWLTSGDVERITSELGVKIATGNASNYIKALRANLESGKARKKGSATPCRLNRSKVLKKDSRVRRVGADVWMIPADRFTAIEQDLGLDRCLPTAIPVSAKASARRLPAPKRRITGDAYIDAKRIKELKGIRSTSFDLSRLLAMCDEVNDNAPKNHIATILLVRAILDHVPPIFSSTTFKEVANNFGTTKSIKASLQHLENSSRTIADTYLHTPIRKKETLPNKTQVKFSQDLDVLLAEIVRILSI